MKDEYRCTPVDITKQPFYGVLKELYRSLPGMPLTAAALAEALAPHVTGLTPQELELACLEIRDGLRKGRAMCREMIERGNAAMDEAQIARELHALLQDCPEEERKARLLCTVDYLLAGCGHTLQPHMCGPFAASTEEELVSDVAFLVSRSGTIALDQLLSTYEKNAQTARADLADYAERFTREEHLWIAAAVAYADELSRTEETGNVTPMEVGAAAGEVYGVLDALVDAANDYILPGVIGVAGTVLGVLLLHKMPDIMLACEAKMMTMAFFASESTLSMAIMGLPGAALALGSYVLFCVGVMGLVSVGMKAYEDIQERMEGISQRHRVPAAVEGPVAAAEPVKVEQPVQPVVSVPVLWEEGSDVEPVRV